MLGEKLDPRGHAPFHLFREPETLMKPTMTDYRTRLAGYLEGMFALGIIPCVPDGSGRSVSGDQEVRSS